MEQQGALGAGGGGGLTAEGSLICPSALFQVILENVSSLTFPSMDFTQKKIGLSCKEMQELRPPCHPWGSAESSGQEPWPGFAVLLPSLTTFTPHNDGTQSQHPCTSRTCFHPIGLSGSPTFMPYSLSIFSMVAGRAQGWQLGGNRVSGNLEMEDEGA